VKILYIKRINTSTAVLTIGKKRSWTAGEEPGRPTAPGDFRNK